MHDGNEVWQEEEEVFLALLNDFYSWIFTSSNPYDLDCILDRVQPVVTEEMWADLDRPFLSKEVGEAIMEMASLKAPGPNGMPPLFF